MNNIQELIQKHDGTRYQEKLANLIVEKRFTNIVETGHGVTTLHILNALDQIGEGRLISIDPHAWFSDEIVHPRLILIKQKSVDCLLDMYYQYGPFDLLNHDSDHEILCQTYEYNLGYSFLNPGGVLSSDDHGWGSHGAWKKFCESQGLTSTILGDAEYVTKPMDKPYCPSSEARLRHETILQIATDLEKDWLDKGGIKHPAFA